MDMLGECRLGAVAEGTEVDSPYLFNVIPETEKVPARVIVRTSNSEPYAPFDYAFSVIDYDGDGTVTTDDALHQIHDWYYAGCASDCKAARGQNKIWGRTGAFVCEVQNADGQIVFTGAAAAENAVPYVLEPECTVTFRPETVLDKMYQVRWYDGHAMTETASLAPGEHTGIQAICWLPDKTFEDLVVNAEVLIDGKATGIFTDEYGMADIPANLKGLHTITVRAEGADAFNTLSFTVGNGGEATQTNTEPVNNAETAAEPAEPETVRTEAQETIVHQAVTKLPSNASAAAQNESVQTVTAQASSAPESDPTPMILMILSSGALCAFAGGMFMMFRKMK
jgi:hypothetical protein